MALSCKYVDEVVIGAPFIITKDLINSLNIQKVVHVATEEDRVLQEFADIDPYYEAKKLNIFEELPA
jgi:ethanolamine-phosphate cytidylyltransferase